MDDIQAFAFPQLDSTGPVNRAGDLAQAVGDLLAGARAEADQIRATAAQEGRAAGYAAGLAEAQAQLEPARTALEAAATGLVAAHEGFLEIADTRAVELALAIARKVIGVELAVRPELVVEVATGALRRAAERDHVVLLVNPDDIDLVREAAADLSGALGMIRRLEIAPERRVDRGGCLVQTAEGEIDAGIETQLEKVREVLLGSLQPSTDA